MNKDKKIEELFLANKPHFDDSEAFMSSLTKRLDAVEFIKQQQEAELRRYKMIMVAAFIVGVISGGTVMVLTLSMPADVPLFTFKMQSDFLLWLSEKSRIIVTTVLSLLMSFGLISIVKNVFDIVNMRKYISSAQGF